MNPTDWLRSRVRSHNRHAFGLGLLSLAAAALAWNLAWYAFEFALLGGWTAVRGDFGLQVPAWIPVLAIALLAVLLVWGVWDQFRGRYEGVSDRAIIGWHLVGDFLLLPVRLTFAAWGNFSAARRLGDEDLARAWELLVTIRRDGKARLRSLALIEPDTATLFRLVTTLQMLDLIDLHRGEGDWFYTVRSTRLEQVGKWIEA